jgi:hypothetical protein
MDFFHSLPLDLKMLVVAIAGCALLALFSGNRNNEKRYVLALALLTIGGVYRFTHVVGGDERPAGVSAGTVTPMITTQPKHVPLVSTSSK